MLGVFGRGSSFPRDTTNVATPDPGTQRFSPLLNMSKLSDYPKKRGPREATVGIEDGYLHPFSVTEINSLIIPSLLRRDRATGMPRSLTIERKVSALRQSHGNIFWLDMTVATVMMVWHWNKAGSRFSRPNSDRNGAGRHSPTPSAYPKA